MLETQAFVSMKTFIVVHFYNCLFCSDIFNYCFYIHFNFITFLLQEVFTELEQNRPKVETVLQQGQEYLKKSGASVGHLQHSLKTLKTRWDSVTARANDKKIKLEIALKEATEFHDALQVLGVNLNCGKSGSILFLFVDFRLL